MAALNLCPGLTIMPLVRTLAANMPYNRAGSVTLIALLDRQQSSTASLSLSPQILSQLSKLFFGVLHIPSSPF